MHPSPDSRLLFAKITMSPIHQEMMPKVQTTTKTIAKITRIRNQHAPVVKEFDKLFTENVNSSMAWFGK